jgi:hypothetical protein
LKNLVTVSEAQKIIRRIGKVLLLLVVKIKNNGTVQGGAQGKWNDACGRGFLLHRDWGCRRQRAPVRSRRAASVWDSGICFRSCDLLAKSEAIVAWGAASHRESLPHGTVEISLTGSRARLRQSMHELQTSYARNCGRTNTSGPGFCASQAWRKRDLVLLS